MGISGKGYSKGYIPLCVCFEFIPVIKQFPNLYSGYDDANRCTKRIAMQCMIDNLAPDKSHFALCHFSLSFTIILAAVM